jgi:TolA-binding protein
MMKQFSLFVCLSVLCGAICAEQTDSCAGLEGYALAQCRANQQSLRQGQLEQQLQQQEERQNQLDKQQRDVQQQLESLRLQNESLRKQLEREASNRPARPPATDDSKSVEVKNWRAENPWFGTDYVKTEFAVRYIKQLQQERPDLAGRALLDALSAKVNESFAAKH